MQFQKGYIYHIYNQGNNRQKIFFYRENYLFFLKKLNIYITPYTDILAWCLMPNHFHLMVYIRETELEISDRMTPSEGFTPSEAHTNQTKRSFNHSIGILLRTYTRAINKQEKRSGSLFRKVTKAECVNCPQLSTPSFVGNKINIVNPERQYPQVLFEYIHQNPVKAGLSKEIIDWEFSSARDYYAGRRGKLVNKELAEEYVEINILG